MSPLPLRHMILLTAAVSVGLSLAASRSTASPISVEFDFACGVTPAGTVKCWGDNFFGQLGDGTEVDRLGAIEVAGLSDVKAVAVSGSSSCALTNAGAVRCWGELELPLDNVPGMDRGVLEIAGGAFHFCALMGDRSVRCWGMNGSGQLGTGATSGGYETTPQEVVGLDAQVRTIAAGGYHTCAVSLQGAVRCWGRNDSGQLGDGTTEDRTRPVAVLDGIKSISTGSFHTCAATEGGAAKCWGLNRFGQLGDGTTERRLGPVDVAGLSGKVKEIAAGGDMTCARIGRKVVRCWGVNASGELGDGTTKQSSTPTKVVGLRGKVRALSAGVRNVCLMTRAGKARCWGRNSQGALGNGVADYIEEPVDVPGLESGVTKISAGSLSTCASLAGGTTKCWGQGGCGQLGDQGMVDRPDPVSTTITLERVKKLELGHFHSCALSKKGGVQCWGCGGEGILGNDADIDSPTPVSVVGLKRKVRGLSAAHGHTCAVTGANGVRCWGDNTYGQLGDGSVVDRWVPTEVPGLTGVTSVEVNDQTSCAVLASGGARCWGSNTFGQLGDGTRLARSTPVPVEGLAGPLKAIAPGYAHTCGLLESGGVQCWGVNSGGRLGDGTTTSFRVTPGYVDGLSAGVVSLASGSFHTCALTDQGGVKCWGDNLFGHIGDGTTEDRRVPVDVKGLTAGVKAISAGWDHTCALTDAGGVKCWGWAHWGQLGNGLLGYSTLPGNVVGF